MDIKVIILEDNREIRESINILLQGSPGFTCLKAFDNMEDAVNQIPVLKPDVALIDIHLPEGSGHECISKLKPICSETQFVIFSIFEDNDNIFKALSVGATGYLTKNTPPAKILEAIADVYHGGSPMSGAIARKVISSFQKSQQQKNTHILTSRETDILDLLSKGYRYKEIAAKLFISVETVRTHIRNIYEKLQVNNRTEAINKIYKQP